MCTSPVSIKNPNKGRDPTKYPNYWKDCISTYIKVPCQNCPDCIAMNQMELVQRIQMESLKNWLFMGTVTYDNEHLPRLDVGDYQYRYADINHFSGMIKRLKRKNTFEYPFREVYVSERGGKGGRPHFHCLLMFRKEDIGKNIEDAANFAEIHKWDMFNEWKIVKGKGRFAPSEQLSQYRESIRYGILHKTYDFHFVDPRLTEGGITDAAFYVLKYMMKAEEELYKKSWEQKVKGALFTNYDEEEAQEYWNIIKSKQIHTLYFGYNAERINDHLNFEEGINKKENFKFDEEIIQYLKDGVKQSIKVGNKFPYYYCPEAILTFPLAKYYKNNPDIYSVEDHDIFIKRNLNDKPCLLMDEPFNYTDAIKKFNDYERKLKVMNQDVFSETLEELYTD